MMSDYVSGICVRLSGYVSEDMCRKICVRQCRTDVMSDSHMNMHIYTPCIYIDISYVLYTYVCIHIYTLGICIYIYYVYVCTRHVVRESCM